MSPSPWASWSPAPGTPPAAVSTGPRAPPTTAHTPQPSGRPTDPATPTPTPTATATQSPTPAPTPSESTGSGTPATAGFAPYVDTSLYPAFDLVAAAEATGVKDYNLAFVTDGGGCTPKWGGVTDLTSDAVAAQIGALRAQGGDVRVSFGGAAGTELATACPSAEALATAYGKVVDAYRLTKVDFDVEGGALPNTAANTRRAQAIAKLQQRHPGLDVSFTLPVMPEGLTQAGVDLLADARKNGVKIATVNIMAMDYGPAYSGDMGTYAEQAATATQAQIKSGARGRGRQVEVVRGAQGRRRFGAAGGVDAGAVAEEGAAPRLVQGDPLLHPVAERLADDLRVLGEAVGGVALRPAARVLQLLRQVPVVEGDGRLDAVREQLVDQAPVEVQADLDGGAAAGRLHPGPGDREAVRGQAQLRHHRHVVAEAVVVVDGDVTGVAAGRLARRMAEGVPDRRRPAVLADRALDLVGGGGRAPEEGRGEGVGGGRGRRGHRNHGLRHGSAPRGRGDRRRDKERGRGGKGKRVGRDGMSGAEAAVTRPPGRSGA
ncbi:hypothetical protein SGLAM104S_09630 [Streptomyces glaucescens]